MGHLFFLLAHRISMLISLGYHCGTTLLNVSLHIKKETGVFEYFESRKLQYITDVINTLTNDPNQNVICGSDKNIYLLDTNFLSAHYNIDEYKTIFQRRYNRFLEIINREENIYFVRINPTGKNTSKNELELFIESIRKLNPHSKIIFLLIDTIHDDSDISYITMNIDNVLFYHKYFYDKDVGNDVYFRNNPIISEHYKKMLEDIGYNVNDQSNVIFNDKSAF